MKNDQISQIEILVFQDKFNSKLILTSEFGKKQLAEICISLERNDFIFLKKNLTSYFKKPEISTLDSLDFFTSLIDEDNKDKDLYWHIRRFILIANSSTTLTSQKKTAQKNFTDLHLQSICEELDQFVSTKPTSSFLLEGVKISTTSELNEKTIDYLFSSLNSLKGDASFHNWLSQYSNLFLLKIKDTHSSGINTTLKDKCSALLIASIAQGINYAVKFLKTHGNSKKIHLNDLPFNLKNISDVCQDKLIDDHIKTKILLELNDPLNNARIEFERDLDLSDSEHSKFSRVRYDTLELCNSYPVSIVKTFQSWDDMNKLVEKHPFFLESDVFKEPDALKNLTDLYKQDPEQTQRFVKNNVCHFLRMFNSDLSNYHDVYLDGLKEPSASFSFLRQVLNKQDDVIDDINNLPVTCDYSGKAIALLLIQTPNAFKAKWGQFKTQDDSTNLKFNLDRLIDNYEDFPIEEFHQLALNNERIAYKFIQVKSERFQLYLEYKPELVRELFKKYPEIIAYVKTRVLKAVFKGQENLIEFIPVNDSSSVVRTLLAINTFSALKKAKVSLRALRVDHIPSTINHLFSEFNHSHIIEFVNESFSNEELQSMFKAINFNFFLPTELSTPLAKFLLEKFAKDYPQDEYDYESKKTLLIHCFDFLYEKDAITVDELFLVSFELNYGLKSYSRKKWEYELQVLIINKIKIESQKKEKDTTYLNKLIALLPKSTTQNESIELDDPWWDCSMFDRTLQDLNFKINNFKIDTIKQNLTNPIPAQEVLFDSDFQILRKGMHERFLENLIEIDDDFSIVNRILFDAKNAIRKKLETALTDINQPVSNIDIFFSDIEFYPSRLSLENVLKPLNLDPSTKDKVLDRCSDEILPALLHECLKSLIFSETKIDAKTNLMVFIQTAYKEYPQGWARLLHKVLEDYKSFPNSQMIKGTVFALGELREPLGEKIPKLLDKISKDEDFMTLRDVICRQKMLFNRENFNRGHFRKPQRRVVEALQHLIMASQL